jgi:hypothetical protein
LRRKADEAGTNIPEKAAGSSEKKSVFLLEISHIMAKKFPVNFRIYFDYGTLCQTFSIIVVTSWIFP